MKVTLLNHSNATTNREKIADAAAALCVDKYEDAVYNHPDKTRHMEAAIASGHLSVIEHLPLTFLVEDVSRALTHQLVRHRIASYSQLSQRYAKVDTNNNWYVTPNSILQSNDRVNSNIYTKYDSIMTKIAEFYKEMCEAGIPNEDARFILPNACYTSIIVSMNARAFSETCVLRTCNKAQWEIRELFIEMRNLIRNVYPNIYELCFPNCVYHHCKESKPCGKFPKFHNDEQIKE